MTRKNLSFQAPPAMAIAADATTPDPGQLGVQVWSTVANATLTWNGVAWKAPTAGGGGSSSEFALAALGGF